MITLPSARKAAIIMFKVETQYRSISKYYDILNDGAAYDEYLAYINGVLENNGINNNARILDLACGTGEVSLRLHQKGYKVIALDFSPDMLSEASFKASDINSDDIFFTCQDMRNYRLYAQVDSVVCLYDSLNYLLLKKDVESAFQSTSNALKDGGIFIFDVSTSERYDSYYADNTFLFDYPELFCAWENRYNKEKHICDFYLTLFTKNNGAKELYSRIDEHQRQRYYSEQTLKTLLDKAGFDVLSVCTDKDVFSYAADNNIPHKKIFTAKKRISGTES